MRVESNNEESRQSHALLLEQKGKVAWEIMQPKGSSTQKNSATAPSDVATSKKKRNQPGTPKPDAEVVALSPRTLLATNRFVCEVCNKGFQRDQNLQLHLRGHNMPWKLKQRNSKEARRRVYLCPEPTCVHHNPSRALGDLTGIKKHYCRKHSEKHLKCDKCNKRYAVESDWKAHCKTCGTREYRCECDTVFARKDSFIAHRATCEAAIHAFREAAQLSPLAGAGLNVASGSGSPGLSGGTAAQMHGFADQGQSSSSAAEASLFDHVMPSYPGSSSMFRSEPPSDFSPSFFFGGGAPPTHQDLSEDGGDHSEASRLGPLLLGKAPLHELMMQQLSEQQQYHQPSSSNAADFNLMDFAFLSGGSSGGASGSQGPLLHGKEPFHGHGHDLMQLLPVPQQQHHQPGISNANVNLLPNLGFLSGNSGGSLSGSGSSQQLDARLVIQDQFSGCAGGSNTEEHGNVMGSIGSHFGGGGNTDHGNVMASIGSHFVGGGFPSQYNSSPSPSRPAALSATALLMKAAQMGSTSSSTSTTTRNRNGAPGALLRAAGFTGTASGQGNSRAAAEEAASHEAHFHDLLMNSLPLMGGTGIGGGFPGNAGMAGVDDGNLSTRDFLGGGGGGRDDAVATQGLHMGALDSNQMKWYM